MEVNFRFSFCSGERTSASAGGDETPPWVPGVAASIECGGKSERRRSDCGTGRSDTQGRETGDTPSRVCRSHARSRCAPGPYCRTFRSARTRHIRGEPPRRKSACRTLGNARGAALPIPPHSLWRFVYGNGGDCRYDRRGTTNFLPPGKSAKGYVKVNCNGKFHLNKVVALCTMKQEVQDRRIAGLPCGACARGNRDLSSLPRHDLGEGRTPAKKRPSPQDVDNPARVSDNHR
jgi:hypothetical protein